MNQNMFLCREYQGHGLLGSRSLARKLTQELVEHIKVRIVHLFCNIDFVYWKFCSIKCWIIWQVSLPELRKNVREGLDNVQNKLKRLGKGVSTNPHQRQIQFVEVELGCEIFVCLILCHVMLNSIVIGRIELCTGYEWFQWRSFETCWKSTGHRRSPDANSQSL